MAKYITKKIEIEAWQIPSKLTISIWKKFKLKNNLPDWELCASGEDIGVVLPSDGIHDDYLALPKEYIVKEKNNFYPLSALCFKKKYEKLKKKIQKGF